MNSVTTGLVYRFGILIFTALGLTVFYQNCAKSQFEISGERPVNSTLVSGVVGLSGSSSLVVLEGQPSSLSLSPTLIQDLGSSGVSNYIWTFTPRGSQTSQVLTGVTGSSYTLNPTLLTSAGTYNISHNSSGAQQNVGVVNLDVIPRLELDAVNFSDQTLLQGQALNLVANGTGPSPIEYHWTFTPEGGTTQVDLSSFTTASLNYNTVDMSNEGLYEIMATSNEGGIFQEERLPPIRVKIVEPTQVTGQILGDVSLVEGENLDLTSVISGISPTRYEWIYNDQVIAEQTGSVLSLSNIRVDQAGEYFLKAYDSDDRPYDISNVFVTVKCNVGSSGVNDSCLANSKACPIENGTGIHYLMASGEYGECRVNVCHSGYSEDNNLCVAIDNSCPISNGEGVLLADTNKCSVTLCSKGYFPNDSKTACERKSCSVAHGTGFLKPDELDQLSCQDVDCQPGFVNQNNACVSDRQSCPINGGLGFATVTTSGVGPCELESCHGDFIKSGGKCISKKCNIAGGDGAYQADSNGALSCVAQSCSGPYLKHNNSCVLKTCSVANGVGMHKLLASDLVCQTDRCFTGFTKIGGQCVQEACSVSNGVGQLRAEGQGSKCMVKNCNKDYVKIGDQCQKAEVSCEIANGSGLGYQRRLASGSLSQCYVNKCNDGFIISGNTCVPEKISCNLDLAKNAFRLHNEPSSSCRATECMDPSTQSLINGRCFENSKSCEVSHGSGSESLMKDGSYSSCEVDFCNPGFEKYNNKCMIAERPCRVGEAQGLETLTATGYGSCELRCQKGYIRFQNQCFFAGRPVCEPNTSKNTSTGKVFGHVYFTPQGKTRVDQTIKGCNRIGGIILADQINFGPQNSNAIYPKFYDGRGLRNKKGLFLKAGYGFQTYTKIIPPEGEAQGNYTIAVEANDSVFVDFYSGSSWYRLLKQDQGPQAQSVFKYSDRPFILRKSNPLLIRTRYVNLLGDNALKLLWKNGAPSKKRSDYTVIPASSYVQAYEGGALTCSKQACPSGQVMFKGVCSPCTPESYLKTLYPSAGKSGKYMKIWKSSGASAAATKHWQDIGIHYGYCYPQGR